MDTVLLLTTLLELAETLGVEMRRVPHSADPDSHPGGAVVRLKGRQIVFLDGEADPTDQAQVLAAALRGRPEIAGMFLPPEIRELLGE